MHFPWPSPRTFSKEVQDRKCNVTEPKTPRPKGRQARAVQRRPAKSADKGGAKVARTRWLAMAAEATRLVAKPWGDLYRRFIAAEVATGRRSKESPEAVVLMAHMGGAFEALQSEVMQIRDKCGISTDAKPELAELLAMQAFTNTDGIRSHQAALEALRESLKATLDASRIADGLLEGAASHRTRVLAAQLYDVEGELRVLSTNERRRPRLAATAKEARKVRAHEVGMRLAESGVERKEAAKYLLARGLEKMDRDDANDPYEPGCAPDRQFRRAEYARALENQGKREKKLRNLKPWLHAPTAPGCKPEP